MNETTGSVLEETRADREEILTVTITGIRFENDDPCKPRYAGLYHNCSNGSAQLEPLFQLADHIQNISIVLELADSGVEFVPEEGQEIPLCRQLGHRDPDPDVTIQYGLARRSCVLTWKASPKTTRVYRIYCRRTSGEFTLEHKVYGGLFVSFSTHPVGSLGKLIPSESPGAIDHQKIRLLGTDHKYRPIYDVHRPSLTVPRGVELEPAYRVRQGEELSFHLIMKIKKAKWKPEPWFPGQKPTDALTWELRDLGTSFQFRWKDRSTPRDRARAVTFLLVPELAPDVRHQPLPADLADWGTWEKYAEALQCVGVDPTIIQPPKCDPVYDVCAPEEKACEA